MVKLRMFKFGVETSPWWFLQKVQSKDVEYIHASGRVIGCRFYDTKNEERVIAFGEIISTDMLYTEEPVRMNVEDYNFRHYSTEQIERRDYEAQDVGIKTNKDSKEKCENQKAQKSLG